MVSIPPPRDWQARLEERRAERDRLFRTSPDSPLEPGARAAFGGLDYFPSDASRYFVGAVQPYAESARFEIPTTGGAVRPCERVGSVGFTIDDRALTLQVYRLLDTVAGGDDLFLPFADATAGEETYPAGRYVDLDGPPGGPYVLDFNGAYNPSCAYGSPARFACPITPPENRLPVRIAAGERGWTRPQAVLVER